MARARTEVAPGDAMMVYPYKQPPVLLIFIWFTVCMGIKQSDRHYPYLCGPHCLYLCCLFLAGSVDCGEGGFDQASNKQNFIGTLIWLFAYVISG